MLELVIEEQYPTDVQHFSGRRVEERIPDSYYFYTL